MTRLEQLQSFVASSPADPFPRYGVAMELKNLGRLDEARVAFDELVENFPDYTPAYFHSGAVSAAMGRRDEAKRIYEQGISATAKKGDLHAKGELEAALGDLELTGQIG